MPPLSFPSFGEDSCSGDTSYSATSCDGCPSAQLHKISEPACRLWFFLTGRSTLATSFVFSFHCVTLAQIPVRVTIVGHDGDYLQIAVRRLGMFWRNIPITLIFGQRRGRVSDSTNEKRARPKVVFGILFLIFTPVFLFVKPTTGWAIIRDLMLLIWWVFIFWLLVTGFKEPKPTK